jgi:hypothetical protein
LKSFIVAGIIRVIRVVYLHLLFNYFSMKIIRSFLVVAVLAGALFLSCKKSKGPTPDLDNFTMADSGSFLPGGQATITVNSTTLADGTYTIYYVIFPDGYVKPYATGVHSTLVMSNHVGTFQTAPLDTPNYVVISAESISNQAGGTTFVNSRLGSYVDSLGMMKVQKNGKDTFSTPAVKAKFNGAMIEVDAYSPQLGTITGYDFVTLIFNNQLGVQILDSNNGQGQYGHFYNSVTANIFTRTTLTITSLTPLLTGSFSAVCADSTKFTGTFSCPAPR